MKSSRFFKIGTRASDLARVQTREALARLTELLPELRFEEAPVTTIGDRDRKTDLRNSPSDFFTRELDAAVLDGALDAAVHSAKDLPAPVPAGLDWFWLPGHKDPRDVLVARRGFALSELPNEPVVGVSSVRREEYCRRRFPGAVLRPLRGTIEERLRQLDEDAFDILVMAAAGLIRLGLKARIGEWIPLADLPTPAGQGVLAMTFRAGDLRWLRIRSLLVRPVVFAGAGAGSRETCTLGALDALKRCDICFHDKLIDSTLLTCLPRHAEQVDIGKRCGDHRMEQTAINESLTVAARRGRRVVRLKGGDPGVFGRLTEEIDTLDSLHLPYRVIPGVSSLNAATTGTGMLLTRRGVSRGFTVLTPRQQNGGIGSVRKDARAALPMVFFMGVSALNDIVAQLRTDGLPETTPAAIVFDAGSVDESVVRGSLGNIEAKIATLVPPPSHLSPITSHLSPATRHPSPPSRPALIIVGNPASCGYHPEWGALMGRRVLLTCSEALQGKASDAVHDFGGVPVQLPLIRMVPDPACLSVLKRMREFDRLVVTSPSAVHAMMRLLLDAGLDVRGLPGIITSGPGTAEALKSRGIMADLVPERDFGAEGLIEAVKNFKKNKKIPQGAAILRLRSQLAGPHLADALAKAGFEVTDCVLYRNELLRPERIPAFDAIFFASASAVEAFLSHQPADLLDDKIVAALGKPTLAALEKHGVRDVLTPPDATVTAAIRSLAVFMVNQAINEMEMNHDKTPHRK